MIEFTVPGAPVGKGRPRIGRVAGHARMFTPEKTANYENLVRHCAAVAMAGRSPIVGACIAVLDVIVPVPQSWSKKKQAQALAGEVRPTTKPDIDNVLKALADAMNQVVWRDDSQLVQVVMSKAYGAAPGVRVQVREA